VAADKLGFIPHNIEWQGPPDVVLRLVDDFDVTMSNHPLMPAVTVRYLGEPVAIVVAETADQAADAAELVEVDYEPLPLVTDARAAMAAGAPQIWPDRPGNVSMHCEVGDAAATEAAFQQAAHVVKLDTWVNRITGVPMETRAALGAYDAATNSYTLRTASGRGVVQTRERLANILGVPQDTCRVVFGDMGGNYGTRNAFYSEYALVPWASKKVGRPVRWVGSRQECFLTDYQGRDLAVTAELALDADGNFLAMRGTNTMNSGAYTIYFWPLRKGLSIMQGNYRIPTQHFRGFAADLGLSERRPARGDLCN
jgi:aerobic carbon-monoxide dehydrogenase large subunit